VCNKCKGNGYYFPDKNSDVVVECKCSGEETVKFKIEITVEFNDFVIPPNKSQSMINGMQREQVAFAIQDKLADMNPQIHNVYKQRS
jgi:DnaJ-class molecular chaperone